MANDPLEPIRIAIQAAQQAPAIGNYYEKPFRQKYPNFYRELDKYANFKIMRSMQDFPNELKPDEESFAAYVNMSLLFEAAVNLASFAVSACQGEHGKDRAAQFQELEQWLVHQTPPEWLDESQADEAGSGE
jgi:hypothetical protein